MSDNSTRERELEAALASLTVQLAKREHAHAELECLHAIDQVLVRLYGLEEVQRLLVSMASSLPPLRGVVLVTSEQGPDHPFWWRSPEADAGGQELAITQASAALAYFSGSTPLFPRQAERLFVTLPLVGSGGEILGALLLEWLELPDEPVLALAGNVVHRLSCVLDRRSRAGGGRRVHQTDRPAFAHEDLLARVSHELRNLLSVIEVDLAMLLRSPELQDLQKPRGQLLRIKRSADRMGHLTQDLLDTASLEAESLPLYPRCLEVAPLVQEALEAASPLAATKSIKLKVVLVPGLPSVYADFARVQQVFTNLLSNAIKFSPEGGAITIRAEPISQFVLFSVADEGPGIPEDEQPKLFLRFSQASGAAGGTGLGLFIVKGIVKVHGGDIWVKSEAGAGSTFLFTLPLASPAAH